MNTTYSWGPIKKKEKKQLDTITFCICVKQSNCEHIDRMSNGVSQSIKADKEVQDRTMRKSNVEMNSGETVIEDSKSKRQLRQLRIYMCYC